GPGRGRGTGGGQIGRRAVGERGGRAGAESRDPGGEDRVAGHPVAERVSGPPRERGPPQERVIDRAARAVEERMDQLAKMVHDRDQSLLTLEGGGETPGGDVVA